MKNKGFTLIELLAVIVIIAIILAIAIPSISNMISASSKSAFESNAKLVLKSASYKKLENESFDETTLTEASIASLLGLSNDNYESLSIKLIDGNPVISIVGKNKWNGLVACGTSQNMKIVSSLTDCSTDFISPVITISGNATVSINQSDSYADAGATATDNKDGNITNNIVTASNVNINVPGTYAVTYSVTDNAGNKATATRTVNVIERLAGPNYINSKNVNGPVLATGMIPIKWNENSWVDTTVTDTDWYNYTGSDKKWANARTADGSMWVWIPRYIYKISTGWHSSTTGTIDVQFTKGTNDNWNSPIIGNIDTGTTSNASNNKWTNHPAFTFGTTELTGIWVAKFEPSVSNTSSACYTSPSEVNCNVTTLTPKSVPNVLSWHNISISNAFTVARNMETNSAYGWGTSGSGIDTHLVKDVEWGAAAYLTQSIYGKNANVWVNNSSTMTTGCAGNSADEGTQSACLNAYNTTNGVQASTTGNIYGIYDMSGGSFERLSAYVNNGNASLSTYASTVVAANDKYKTVLTVGTPDDAINNYAMTVSKKGNIFYEVSDASAGFGYHAWNNDYTVMALTDYPCPLFGGGYYGYGTAAGIFAYDYSNGSAHPLISFRPILLVNSGI